jgi:molybdenum cofactor cytidylyltransferase
MTSTRSDISAVILAAGFSSRMGSFKPLLPLGDKPVLARTIELFQQAEIEDIRVVVGHRAGELASLVRKPGVRTIENPDYKTGMLSSVKAGIKSLSGTSRAFFLLPVDIPLVRPTTIVDMLSAWEKGGPKILYPLFLNQRGHPPLISVTLAPAILAWDGSGGLRSFLAQHEPHAAEVPVADAKVLFDMDTAEEYQRAIDTLNSYDIPTTDECMAILSRRFAVDHPVVNHCRTVARVAVHLTRAINSAGCPMDPNLLNASGLLHDLMRTEPDHAHVAARMLKQMGYQRVADIVASHMDIDIVDGAPIQAGEVLYLADKLVAGERVVLLHERFDEKRAGIIDNLEAKAALNARFETVMKIKGRFEAQTGRTLDAVLNDL